MQTSYSVETAVGYAGMIADTGDRHVVSRVNPSVIIPIGCYVTKGTEDDHVKLPTTANEVTKGQGVAIQDWLSESTPTGELPQYPVKSAVSVMRQGRVWVTVEEAVNADDDVYVRYATGTGTQKGAFRKSADTTTAAVLPGARYITSALANGLAQIELNMP